MKNLVNVLTVAHRLNLVFFEKQKNYLNSYHLEIEDVDEKDIIIRHFNDDRYSMHLEFEGIKVFSFEFDSEEYLEAALAAHIRFVAGNESDDCTSKKLLLLADCIMSADIDPDNFSDIDYEYGKEPISASANYCSRTNQTLNDLRI